MKIKYIFLIIVCFSVANLFAKENRTFFENKTKIELVKMELKALEDAISLCKYHSFYLDKPYREYLKCMNEGREKKEVLTSYLEKLEDKQPKTAMEILIKIFKNYQKEKVQNYSKKEIESIKNK